MTDERRKQIIVAAVIAVVTLFGIIWSAMGNMDGFWISGAAFGQWLAAFLTIAVLSFLYDDNPLYRVAESLFIGVSAAYWMVQGVWSTLIPNALAKLTPELAAGLTAVEAVEPIDRVVALVQITLGIMLLMRLAPKAQWLSRWPLAVIVGWAAGTNLMRYLTSDFTKQVSPTFVPLLETSETGFLGVNWVATLSAFVTVFGLLVALIYFFFSVEHKGVMGKASRVGIWVLMITFGAAFGYTVMGRIALLVGRMEFLFVDWLKVIGV